MNARQSGIKRVLFLGTQDRQSVSAMFRNARLSYHLKVWFIFIAQAKRVMILIKI